MLLPRLPRSGESHRKMAGRQKALRARSAPPRDANLTADRLAWQPRLLNVVASQREAQPS